MALLYSRALVTRALLPVAVALYALWGVYSVQSDESAVAFVFGKAAARDVLPGIHWNPPWPVGRVVVAKTATNFTMPVGYRFIDKTDTRPVSDLWLTGDANVVTARLNIQYSVRSLAELLLSHESPRELVRRTGERVLTRFMVAEGVDPVLTTRRHDLREAVHAGVQALLDLERVGIDVQSITVQELAPPSAGGVRSAFQEVQNASADRERTIYEASAYKAQTVAEAAGDAERLRSEGKAARHGRIELARGEGARFAAIASAHARSPSVTEQRLYLETIDRMLPKLKTYVIEPSIDGKVHLRVVE